MFILQNLAFVIAASPTTAECSDTFVTTLVGGLSVVTNILMALGIAIAVIGIVLAGLMRATSWLAWGSESQRVAMSNKAITGAVIGLVIVLLGSIFGGQIPHWFGQSSCPMS